MSEEVLQRVLQRAHALIESGWCRLSDACDAQGDPCSPLSQAARSFSLAGALDRACFEIPAPVAEMDCLYARLRFMGRGGLVLWNVRPWRKRADVLSRVQQAFGGSMPPCSTGVLDGPPVQ